MRSMEIFLINNLEFFYILTGRARVFYNIVTHAFKLKSVAAHQMPVVSLYKLIHQALRCTFSSSIRVNISSSPAKRSFPSNTPLSRICHFRHSNHRQQQAFKFVAAFVLPGGLSNKCLIVLRMR